MSEAAPDRISRRGSSQRSLRRQASAPYGPKRAGGSSTGLTEYVEDARISFDDDDSDLRSSSRTSTMAGKAAGVGKAALSAAISFGRGTKTGPQEISIWKPNEEDVLGITFEVPADSTLKGVLVTDIHPEFLMAKSKKLKIGDVIHVIDGKPVTTPQEAAMFLRDTKGVIQLAITRAGAKSRVRESSSGDRQDSGRGSKRESAASEMEDSSNTTVVVSCSQLILESKKIIGSASGLDEQLDALYSALKAKEVPSQRALARLIELVGQTTVEQAGLVIANAQQGKLPEGWVEYFDQTSEKYYYYNVHTKATTWIKPRREGGPPPPPPRRSSKSVAAAASAANLGGSSSDEDDRPSSKRPPSTRKGLAHGLAEAIAAHATRKKMVESVQLECRMAPRHGIRGLQSVSL